MNFDVLITILLALLTLAVTWAGFRLSSGALRRQADAVVVPVEAGAWERAQGIYGAAIDQLQEENGEYRRERAELREQVERQAAERAAMIREIVRLGGTWPPAS